MLFENVLTIAIDTHYHSRPNINPLLEDYSLLAKTHRYIQIKREGTRKPLQACWCRHPLPLQTQYRPLIRRPLPFGEDSPLHPNKKKRIEKTTTSLLVSTPTTTPDPRSTPPVRRSFPFGDDSLLHPNKKRMTEETTSSLLVMRKRRPLDTHSHFRPTIDPPVIRPLPFNDDSPLNPNKKKRIEETTSRLPVVRKREPFDTQYHSRLNIDHLLENHSLLAKTHRYIQIRRRGLKKPLQACQWFDTYCYSKLTIDPLVRRPRSFGEESPMHPNKKKRTKETTSSLPMSTLIATPDPRLTPPIRRPFPFVNTHCHSGPTIDPSIRRPLLFDEESLLHQNRKRRTEETTLSLPVSTPTATPDPRSTPSLECHSLLDKNQHCIQIRRGPRKPLQAYR
ncbi:hypothetical protein QYF36_015194 [Acer negundo]|nr:hypothetical protein QYF36_015194 [Acer negundo]